MEVAAGCMEKGMPYAVSILDSRRRRDGRALETVG